MTSAPRWLRQWASRRKWKAVQSIVPDYSYGKHLLMQAFCGGAGRTARLHGA